MPIITRVYLILDSEITGAMRALANVEIGNCLTVVGNTNVASMDALMPSDETKWMSCNKSNIVEVEGYQVEMPMPAKLFK